MVKGKGKEGRNERTSAAPVELEYEGKVPDERRLDEDRLEEGAKGKRGSKGKRATSKETNPTNPTNSKQRTRRNKPLKRELKEITKRRTHTSNTPPPTIVISNTTPSLPPLPSARRCLCLP
jgi:hypothetical protein